MNKKTYIVLATIAMFLVLWLSVNAQDEEPCLDCNISVPYLAITPSGPREPSPGATPTMSLTQISDHPAFTDITEVAQGMPPIPTVAPLPTREMVIPTVVVTEVAPPKEPVPLPTQPYGEYGSFENLPVCDFDTFEVTVENNKLPADDSPIKCRLKESESVVIPGYQYGENILRPMQANSYIIDQTQGFPVSGASVNTAAKKYAINLFNCSNRCESPYNTLGYVYGNISAKVPWLSAGKSWNDYHFVNRIHLADLALWINSCNVNGTSAIYTGYPTVSIGLVYGAQVNGTYTGSKMWLVWEKFINSTTCTQTVTNITVDQGTALYVNLQQYFDGLGIAHWAGKAAINGSWTAIFDISAGAAIANYVESGLELTANNGDTSNIHIPANFIHKHRFVYGGTTYPWDDEALPSDLVGRSSTPTSGTAPWNIFDIVGNNYTSISAEANP